MPNTIAMKAMTRRAPNERPGDVLNEAVDGVIAADAVIGLAVQHLVRGRWTKSVAARPRAMCPRPP